MAKKKQTREEFIKAHTKDEIAFQIIDEDTVKRLVARGELHLPSKKVDIPKDMRWNTKWMNNELLAGIQNGESMGEIAKRIFPEIMRKTSTTGLDANALAGLIKRNQQAAIRNARTMVTEAENGGRLDSYKNLAGKGVVQKKVWIATPDSRTRETHLAIDGEEQDIEHEFSNGLMFPADGNGEPAEVYNCRCTMRTHIIGFRRADGSISMVKANRGRTMHNDQMDAERGRRGIQEIAKTSPKSNSDYEKQLQNVLGKIYENHRIINNLYRTPLNELTEDDKKSMLNVEFKNLDVKTSKAITETISDLSEKYDSTLSSVRIMTKNEYDVNGNAFAAVAHDYRTDESIMVLNPVKVKDYEKLMERVKDCEEKRWFGQCKEDLLDRYIPTHEFGHTLINMQNELINKTNWANADYGRIAGIRKEIEAVYKDYLTELSKIDTERKKYELEFMTSFSEESMKKANELGEMYDKIYVSKYSLTNSDEFFAECFATRELSDSKNEYVKRIGDIVDKYFKR